MATGGTPLMAAVAKDHTDVIKLLLGRGADMNAKTTTGETALWIAKQSHQADVILLLEKAGAKE